MIGRMGWPAPIAGLRRRIAWAAAWYRSARTTFAVVRLLDRETHFRRAGGPTAARAGSAYRLHRLKPPPRLRVEEDRAREVGPHPQS